MWRRCSRGANRVCYAVVSFLLLLVGRSSGEIRCYCNLPLCVSTGYMCKSAANICYSEASGVVGCLELLPRHKREVCLVRVRNGRLQVPHPNHPHHKLVCCTDDMCNYQDNVHDLRLHLSASAKGNHNQTYVTGDDGGSGNFYLSGANHEAALRQDLWFKAAVIAVPLAGGFILVMLVLLAMRMLKKDSQRQREMQQLRRQRQFKAQLLLADHFAYPEKASLSPPPPPPEYPEKNNEAKAAKLNQQQAEQQTKQNNLYKNVNLALSRELCCGGGGGGGGGDKQYIYSKPLMNSATNNSLCFVSWGKMNWNSSTPV